MPWDSSRDADTSHVNYPTPEVALLYKSKMARPKDFGDFAALLPHLDAHRRTWLADAIALANPEHPWVWALKEQRWSRRDTDSA
ncbi:MAG TPA: hypothetical protein VKI01_09650 [Acidimicrobiia bacterium]|nr:hypothetical protein [Acidimicrobiia bacterium]